MPIKVAAVIVTYNRIDLLLECIEALREQTYNALMDILVIDNASTDDTADKMGIFSELGIVRYFNTGENLGGAGGFNYGFRKAVELDYDYVWVMDDDCIPTKNALEELICVSEALGGEYGFLSSKAIWTDGSPCRMNVQKTSFWRKAPQYLELPTPIEMASFVSLFVKRDTIVKYGLPYKEFFIWGDDLEFTYRISRDLPCYFVPASIVIHKTTHNYGSDISCDTPDRIPRYRKAYRNEMVLFRGSGFSSRVYQCMRLAKHSLKALSSKNGNNGQRIGAIVCGTIDGLRFRPQIEFANSIQVDKRKILELFGEPISFGGQESYVINLLTHMDLSNLSVDLCTPYYCDNENHRNTVIQHDGKVFEFGLPFLPGKSRKAIDAPLRQFLKQHHYDVVHIHSGSTTFLSIAAKAAKQMGVSQVFVHSHATLEAVNWKKRLIRRYASCDMGKYADKVFACSRQAGEVRFIGESLKKLTVIKNGIDVNHFSYNPDVRKFTRALFEISESTLVVGHVGRLSPEKNHLFLINVFNKVVESGSDAVLLLVGDGPEKEKLETRITELGLEDKVWLLGAQSDVAPYLQAMDVFVFPSIFEGLGIVAIEAQASGLPVIASDNVPVDAQITNEFRFLSLDAALDDWRDAIIAGGKLHRTDCSKQVRIAGFDADDTASYIKELYLGIASESMREQTL